MAIKSGFFTSDDGDRIYSADDMTRYFEGIISSGVFANPSNSLQVTAGNGDMTVSVSPGRGIIDCHWIKNDSEYPLTILSADSVLNRIDAIVMRYNISERQIVLAVKTGTPATNPVAPTMLRTESTLEYCLATISVSKGITQISQSNVTDTRADKNVCGWVTNLVDNIDVTALFAQWQAAFDEQAAAFDAYLQEKEAEYDAWFAQLTESLSVPMVVKKYEASYTTTASTTTIPIGISEYKSGDAILVHLGGMLLTEGTDYTVSDTNIVFPSAVASGRTYTCIVFKPSLT